MTPLKRKLNLYRRRTHFVGAGCIFIHVPKVAGTSISHALYGRTLGHYSTQEIAQAFPRLYGRVPVFAVVRDPYLRAMSAYAFARAGRTEHMGMSKPEQYQRGEFRSFESFVSEWLVYQDLSRADPVFRPQTWYLPPDGPRVDLVCRLESLVDQMYQIEELLGRRIVIPRKNVSPPVQASVSAEVVNLVRHLYAPDYESFEYC